MFIFRNYTIENLLPKGASFSGYDDISFIPKDEKELIWFYQVPINFNHSLCIQTINAYKDKLDFILSQISTDQIFFICSLINLFPINDIDNNRDLAKTINSFNEYASSLAINNCNVRFLDIEEYFSNYPSKKWIDWKFYFYSQMIVAPNVALGFATWFQKRILQIKGTRKKCLILDLDNTLWGGILGEDGIEGIKIGGSYPGNAFLYFQEALIELSKQGVILIVCSKNNERDVLEVWEKHPFIKLNKKYISAYRINWNNKADNIREIAKELNIGLDSMVFIDDNPIERELVKQTLPMVIVPDFPEHPYGLMDLYKSIVEDYFRIYELTDEDRKKTEQYKANAERNSESTKFTNLQDFIKSLNIEIDILPADKYNITRIAQMTQKTNQFNLTTKRYTEADISNFVLNGDWVYCISVKDKFGDNGITGAIIIEKPKNKEEYPKIDTFLLSCRILGKGIENVFLNSIMNIMHRAGVKRLNSFYIPTSKNSQVADFYDNFDVVTKAQCNGTKYYTLSCDFEKNIPDYYNIKIK